MPPAEMRRRDRAVSDENWLRSFLEHAPVGVLATVHDGRPFLNSNLFVYDAGRHAIYLHTAKVGRLRANVELDERVCFHVFEMGRLLPAATAKEFSVEYAGVTIFGTAAVVVDPEEAERGLQQLLDKYFPHLRPGEDYRRIVAEELRQTTVYRVDIEQWSGKQKRVPPDFPGAFVYEWAGPLSQPLR